MPSGAVAPGWVLPTCGLGHHHVAARPLGLGKLLAAVPMNGSTSSRMHRTVERVAHPAGYAHVNGTYTLRLPDRPLSQEQNRSSEATSAHGSQGSRAHSRGVNAERNVSR
jgi:hypothetical protein